MNKKGVFLLFRHEKEQSTNASYNVDEPQKHAK